MHAKYSFENQGETKSYCMFYDNLLQNFFVFIFLNIIIIAAFAFLLFLLLALLSPLPNLQLTGGPVEVAKRIQINIWVHNFSGIE